MCKGGGGGGVGFFAILGRKQDVIHKCVAVI